MPDTNSPTPRDRAQSRRRFCALLGAGLIAAPLLAAPDAALAGKAPVYSSSGAAIRGYDPVGYFKQNRPVRGSNSHTSTWNGATWRFASAENKAAFDANPARYAPQFGGYCAWAVSQGYTASTAPDAWTIYNGKLYLNYSKSVRARWEQNKPGNIAKGNRNWPGVLK